MGEESLGEGWAEEQEEAAWRHSPQWVGRAERPAVRNQRDPFRKEAEVSQPDAAEGGREIGARELRLSYQQVVNFGERNFQGGGAEGRASARGRGLPGSVGGAGDGGSPFQEARGE